MAGAAAAEGDTAIKVTATVKDYDDGLWNQEAIDGVTDRVLTSGTAEVIVTGDFAGDASAYTFTVKSYTAKTTAPVVITQNTDETHTFILEKLSGKASGTITLSNGTFSLANISLDVPAVADVEATLDGDPIDYAQLCEDTGFEPGSSVTLDQE